MNAYCITLTGNKRSVASTNRLIESSKSVGNKFAIQTFPAVTPDFITPFFESETWTYPWDEPKEYKGLQLHPYTTTNRRARMACFLSHMLLWQMCYVSGPTLILEDDAVFTRPFDPAPLIHSDYSIIGINDPRGATRKAQMYHQTVQEHPDPISEVPVIDDNSIPQGLAGASAYLMKSCGAFKALEAIMRHGAWPNDALLCRQLMPHRLGQTKTYFTRVQGTASTLA